MKLNIMTKLAIHSTLIGGLALMTACSGAITPESGDPAPQGVQPAEVASVSGAGVTVKFYSQRDANGVPLIYMFEEGSAFAATSPVSALLAQRLTAQEIYLTLAPAGTVAPAELVEAQADEAGKLGRSPELRRIALDGSAVVEKSLATCKTAFYIPNPSWGSNGSWKAGASAAVVSGLAAENIAETQNPVVFGTCSESSTATIAMRGTVKPAWPGGQAVSLSYDVKPLTYGVWYYIASVVGNCNPSGSVCAGQCISGSTPPFCLPKSWGASYSITGKSAGAFDIVTGVWIFDSPPAPK